MSQLFFSYPRRDHARASTLISHLRALRHDVWVDENLEGGKAWWDEIIRRIQTCQAMIVIVSRAALESEACRAERFYAEQLGKPLVPVLIEPVKSSLLPEDLGRLHTVNFVNPGDAGVIQLVNALATLPPAPPLPHPLPPAPPVPVSYLSRLGHAAAAARSVDEQLTVIDRLADVARSSEFPDEREEALTILRAMHQRRDLFAPADHRIREVETALGGRYDRGPVTQGVGTATGTPTNPVVRPVQPVVIPPVPPYNARMVHPQPAPPRFDAAPAPTRSRTITTLAVIGGIAIVLVLMLCGALISCDTGGGYY